MLCFPCLDNVSRYNADLNGLYTAGENAKKLAEELIKLCESTLSRSLDVLDFAAEIKDTLSSLKGGINLKSIKAILELIDSDKMRNSITLVRDLDGLAIDCVDKSTVMKETVERGTKSIPNFLQFEDKTFYSDLEEGKKALQELETDITDLESCAQSMRTLSIFSAASEGSRAFDSLLSKRHVLRALFNRITDLCAIVAKTSQSMATEACCGQIMASVETVKALFHSLQLSKLILKFTLSGKKLINAIHAIITAASDKVKDFALELHAAKTIKNFMNGLNLG
jgi:hypothetical protein